MLTVCERKPELENNLVMKDGKDYAIEREFLATMRDCYPDVDIDKELLKMKGWLISNPDRRKTKRGMPRFINNWLSTSPKREQSFTDKHRDKGWREGL